MERLRRRRLNPHLGVEIDCATLDLDNTPLTEEGARSLFRTAMEHKVVSLRNTGLGTHSFNEFCRRLQVASLEGWTKSVVERPGELLYETYRSVVGPWTPETSVRPEFPGMLQVGPWPSATGAIGNAVWHADAEYFETPGLFTCLRIARIPRDPETGEVLPCGDTMWADMTVAWADLSEEEKNFYAELKCVYDWKVGLPHIKRRAEQGVPGAWERVALLDRHYPSVERPFARRHPITGRVALLADLSFVSHVVGMSRAESKETLRRAMRLSEVPEYQLRLPWHAEGDVMIHDNLAVKHRVVADFYNIPPKSRMLQNISTKGYPDPQSNRLVPGVEIDDAHYPYHLDNKASPGAPSVDTATSPGAKSRL